MIEQLKNLAFRIHIEPLKTIDRAAKVETVVKVLSDIIESYENYIEVEFLKKEDFKKIFDSNSKVLETIKEDLSLLFIDLNIGSFEAALAPNLLELQPPFFSNEILEWKRETFEDYKGTVIQGDYEDPTYLQNIAHRYNEVERNKIFKPLFASLGDGKDYKVNLKDINRNIIRTIVPPDKSKVFYIPAQTPEKRDVSQYSTVQVFAKIKKEGDQFNIIKQNIKEVYLIEEMDHDTYPFKHGLIQFEDTVFVLNKQLECTVEFENGMYIIHCDELDITVWGESRKEVEEAFFFSFYSLYQNYYLEDDINLSEEALLLKTNLKLLIKTIHNESKEK